MAVILMDLVHTEILLRFILLSNVKFEFVLIFADNLRVFSFIFGRSGSEINREMSGLDPLTITVLFQIKTVAYYLLITAFI